MSRKRKRNMRINFNDYENLVLAHETIKRDELAQGLVNLSAIRNQLHAEQDDEDSAEVVYYAMSGNDSMIIDTGDGFAWFVVDNIDRPGPVFGDVCMTGKTATMFEALQALFDVELTDNENR